MFDYSPARVLVTHNTDGHQGTRKDEAIYATVSTTDSALGDMTMDAAWLPGCMIGPIRGRVPVPVPVPTLVQVPALALALALSLTRLTLALVQAPLAIADKVSAATLPLNHSLYS